MINLLDRESINSCKKRSPWTLGNEILYKMCSDNFTHETDEKIVAKVWLIGRSYAASVERRKNKDPNEESDNFYTSIIVNTLKECLLDQKLKELKSLPNLDTNTLRKTIETHYYLTNLLNNITDLNNRTFSSKYLHFHIPELFFIYDSRAAKAISRFKIKIPRNFFKSQFKCDNIYAQFSSKCFLLREQIEKDFGIQLTPRELDNLLLMRI
ncbi:MAG: hypothetical protein LLG13_02195 [Bacteroidales bacterium]|nr:hypothetical protein [Bacteroidales bacterium]